MGIDNGRGKPLEDIVYEKLKNAILTSQLPPNCQLVERDIAKFLNVSRTPVRAALKLLEKDGLVAIIPNKGAYVHQETYDEIKAAFAVRLALEKMSVRLAAARIGDAEISALRRDLEAERDAYLKGDRVEAYRLGARFHNRIAELSGNPYLAQYVGDIVEKTERYNIFYLLNDPQPSYAYVTPDEHQAILRSLEAREPDSAEGAMSSHVESMERQLKLFPFHSPANLSRIFE
ncbi:MAG: GntR family transcriptional regulator [Bacillota bacterium]